MLRGLIRRHILFALGVAVLLLGYPMLLFTNPMGRNLPSFLAPLLIVSGIALVGADAVRK